MRSIARRVVWGVAALIVTLLLAPATCSAASPEPYGTNDFGGFRNILPPGTHGLTNATDLFNFETNGIYAPHVKDQLDMYANLVYGVPGLTSAQISNYYKDATFGVPSGSQERIYSPP